MKLLVLLLFHEFTDKIQFEDGSLALDLDIQIYTKYHVLLPNRENSGWCQSFRFCEDDGKVR